VAPLLRAQDAAPSAAAAEASREEAAENYNTLKGHVDDLLAAQADQIKQIQELKKEIEDLREQMAKPTGNYASPDDLQKVTQAVQDLDKKREADKALILEQMDKLAKLVSEPVSHGTSRPIVADPTPAANPDQNGLYYTVKKDDTLSLIAQAYREQQGLKISVKQIEEANPNVNPARLHVGMKIFIPAPKGFVPKT
jgi:LysM repeat protein